MSEKEVPTQPTIRVEEVVSELTRQRNPAEKPVYLLSGKQIEGKLDLKHRTIEVAVDIQNCDFLEEVDLRYCEFKQAVNFSDCRFRRRFNSGDEIESRTVYHKDLNCMRSVFEGSFDLNGGVVEGSAYFSEAKFLNEERSIVLVGTSVGGTVEFEGTFFKGETYFNAFKCGDSAYFDPATSEEESQPTIFEKEANFGSATFGRDLICVGATFAGEANFDGINCGSEGRFDAAAFEKEADFSHATFGRDLICRGATFAGKATFYAINCGNNALFGPATFEGEVRPVTFEKEADFMYATFGGSLVCVGATFAGKAKFNTINCGNSAFFGPPTFEGEVRPATFKGEADFGSASFSRNLICRGATFAGEANFNTINCGNSAFFGPATFEGEVRPATFKGEADFGSATFGVNLECVGATFAGKAKFNAINCGGSAFFNPAISAAPPGSDLNSNEPKPTIFEKEVDFVHATFGDDLTCANATFTGAVYLAAINVSGALELGGASFRGYVSLYQSQIGLLSLGNTLPFGDHSQLNLRECRFNTFNGDPSVARKMAAKQPSAIFSRDPYLQLEKYYHGVGNDLEAKRMHYTGRNELRKNALRPKDSRATNWGWFTRWGDWWIKWLTGYGVRTWQLLIPILVFPIVGTVVFWETNALLPASAEGQGASNVMHVDKAYLLSTQPEEAHKPSHVGQHLFDRAVYSLDLFLPLVNLHVDENWQPNGLGRQIYALVHSMVGWILVPLLLASLSGIIRRE